MRPWGDATPTRAQIAARAAEGTRQTRELLEQADFRRAVAHLRLSIRAGRTHAQLLDELDDILFRHP